MAWEMKGNALCEISVLYIDASADYNLQVAVVKSFRAVTSFYLIALPDT